MRCAAAAMLSLALLAPPAGAQDAAVAPAADTQAATQAATQAVTSWLALADSANYAESWTQGAALFRGAVTQAQWEQALRAARTPFGAVKSRTLASAQYTRSIPGAPPGEYVLVQYHTEFANKAGAIETVVPMREADGSWKVSGYAVR